MKKAALALLLAAPLAAQSFEASLFVGGQSYSKFTNTKSVETDGTTVIGLRGGYSFVDFGPLLLQGTVGYQMESEGKISVNGYDSGEKYRHSATALGAMLHFKAIVAVGAGLEYRLEKLSTSYGRSTNYGRPWVRAHAGYAIPSPLLKPFLGLEVAAPLGSTDVDPNPSDENALRSLAPKFQVGVYAGIRF